MRYSAFVPRAAALGCALLIMPLADAATLTVKAGKWRITATINSSFFPQPQTKTVTECLQQAEVDPIEMFKGDDNCRASNVQQNGNSISWDMACKGGKLMPTMTGTARYTSLGETMEGYVRVEGSLRGQKFSMETTSTGSYLGACD
jgi:hypothetical protein